MNLENVGLNETTSIIPILNTTGQYPKIDINWSLEVIVGVIIIAVVMPIILAGNILVIIAVVQYKLLKFHTNYFILFLAVADVFVGLLIPFTVAVEVNKVAVTNIVLCLVPHCILMTSSGVSILCLSAIAYDRYTAISRSFQYINIITLKRIIGFIIFIVMYSFLIAWAPLMGYYTDIVPSQKVCSFQRIHTNAVIMLLCGIFVPAYLIIFFCYTKIFFVARRHARAIAAVEFSVHRKIEMNHFAKDTKYAKTLAIVIGAFLVLWLPYQLCIMIESITKNYVADWIRNYLQILSYCNSALNPWIYAYKNSEFRKAFKKIVDRMFLWCSGDGAQQTTVVSHIKYDSNNTSSQEAGTSKENRFRLTQQILSNLYGKSNLLLTPMLILSTLSVSSLPLDVNLKKRKDKNQLTSSHVVNELQEISSNNNKPLDSGFMDNTQCENKTNL